MNPLLERIKKLRALSQSSSPNEAATAAAIAEKLIAEHGIEEAMLDAGPEEGTEPLTDHEPLDMMGARSFVHWKSYLLTNLCDLHGCAHGYAVDKGRRLAVFFGRPDDVALVREFYEWQVAEIERLSKRAGRGKSKAWGVSYRLGCVRGIADAMIEAKKEAQKKAPSTALAVLDARLTEAERLRDEATAGGQQVKPHDDDAIDEQEEAFERGREDGWAAQRRGKKRKEKEALALGR